ncbi:TIGR04222 domain-containing membrane protein [Streptomyces sp. NPDC002133]|uniref:TIGR04222 domain-containing membrane protein n=1 Tax=Streptomyces sp. NPDC002133 TaxID=3154409 RepID=UPI00332E1266
MGKVFRQSAAAGSVVPEALDVYDIAFLAGGAQRVAESVVIALCERGLLVVIGPRVRAAGLEQPQHPVERVVFSLCPRSRSVAFVRTALQRSPQVEEICRRLAAQGLVTESRHRLTRAGRRLLKAARRDESLPAHVFTGPAVLPAGPIRRSVLAAQPVPTGVGRYLARLGRALDDSGPDSEGGSDGGSDGGSGGGSGGGFSCGGGGGSD